MNGGRAIVLRGDARQLPLPDASVDLIVTSPPYFGLRSYTDGGEHYEGQIGSEATPGEWLAALVACTAEWMRVLKPEGSMFVNLGDKYSGGASNDRSYYGTTYPQHGTKWHGSIAPKGKPVEGAQPKCLLGLPWRYALACTDQLGLILRAEIIWAKPNGLPESVTDRVRRAHEQVFHFTRQPRYYSAVDEIREPHQTAYATQSWAERRANGAPVRYGEQAIPVPVGHHALGKLPGSVWGIPSQPLTVPAHLGVDHFAAFPMELPRRVILGWSPPGVCVACGQGRRPVVDVGETSWQRRRADGDPARYGLTGGEARHQRSLSDAADRAAGGLGKVAERRLTGYVCACTPHTDHPGTGESSGEGYSEGVNAGRYPSTPLGPDATKHQRALGPTSLANRPKVGPWREYHFDAWTPPPTRPSVILDPFGGTGTTALVAAMHGRTGISIDRSADYTRLATWRCNDPAERAKALQVPKPPPIPDGMEALF